MGETSMLHSSPDLLTRGDKTRGVSRARVSVFFRFRAPSQFSNGDPQRPSYIVDGPNRLRSRRSVRMLFGLITCLSVTSMVAASTVLALPIDNEIDNGNVDLILLADDLSNPGPGCDQLTVYDVRNRRFVHQGTGDLTRTSPGRTTFDRRFRQFLSVNANNSGKPPFLTLLQAPSGLAGTWDVSWIEGAEFLQKGDIVFLKDDDHFLVSEGNDGLARSDTHGWVAKYKVSEFTRATKPGMWSVGPPIRRIKTELLPSILRLSQDKEIVHLVESPGRYAQDPPSARVRTFGLPDLQEIAPPIDIGKVSGLSGLTVVQAELLPDDRTLLVNRVPMPMDSGPRYLVQVDLLQRTSALVQIADNANDMGTVGGIAFNHAAVNNGLLAVHGGNAVRVYERALDGSMMLRGAIPLPWQNWTGYQSAPWLDVEWSYDGHQIVAARHAHTEGDFKNFVVIDVSDSGHDLSLSEAVESCLPEDSPRAGPIPMEIITSNPLASFISPTAVPSPRPEQATCVCDIVRSRVPIAVISDAVANPDAVEGWQLPLNPNLPIGPNNPRRHCLGLKNPNIDYHPVFNKPTWLVGCP